jgi:cytochrome P450
MTSSFLGDIADAERQTPLPRPGDQGFAEAAKARGGAVGQVVSKWLATAPYAMIQELLDQPKERMPIFKPAIGPAVVVRHEHVLECLRRTDLFTVDLYAPEMARAADDRTKNPQALSHFLLVTDRDDLYRLDDLILRRAVSREDRDALTAMTRSEAERCTGEAAPSGQIDVVQTLAKSVPLRIVADYLGVPPADQDSSPLVGLKPGDPFPIDERLLDVYTFNRIQEGMAPSEDDLLGWVKDIFRNVFNNFNPANPLFGEFRERGILATEYLTAYVDALIRAHKDQLLRGEPVPDTMLTRLLRMQLDVTDVASTALEQELESVLGAPLPEGELARRLSDSMIRSNVFGTIVGAVVNPQEATARIVDSILRLKDGEYQTLNGSSYDEATELASVDQGDGDGDGGSLELLRRYALEALRLQPQGEVLLRLCVQDNTALGGVHIPKGTRVFAAFAGAMRDPDAVPQPLAFDAYRDERPTAYLANADRADEDPQSQTYLQHGYGRHKCLGRYASEITMRESLRALLRLGRLDRLSPLEMDEQGLYAVRLLVGFN